MAAPENIKRLVERFRYNLDDYKKGNYKETQVRREFIDPLFMELGWDVANTAGYAEAYKDVVHEDTVKIGGYIKAPDYCFRIGGTRKFFLEAKKPSVHLKTELQPAYQLRRYAWSAKLPLSILTDFEEFAVYDCRIKPNKGDAAGKARVMYLTFEDYEDKWDELYSRFSRDAILKGAFDKYVHDKKKKRGTAEVDEAFLQEIERWREQLAKSIAKNNPELSVRDLNFAVQITIDRIIFLRICEDRGIEPYGRLKDLQNRKNIYPKLLELFADADVKYNSGLFHFTSEKYRAGEPDNFTPSLAISDSALRDIFKRLYYPDSPYEFSVLPADILGQVYEQFLGHVIDLTPSGRAKVEQKPEVKKAGGVYYTPTYIVDYIVAHTVGKLLDHRKVVGVSPSDTPHLDKPLRVLDPACGSGSFLIGTYQYLLDWYRKYYSENTPAKWAKKSRPPIYQTNQGEWMLSLEERKRILLDHVYGVDIDSQAVEVTKLSLLLKVLEGQSFEQLQLFTERALPDLGDNIKCGNSLIGPDFYDNHQMELLDEEELYRVNAFDWRAEFPYVFDTTLAERSANRKKGFDAVIGNPPYFNVDDTWGKGDPKQKYLKSTYAHVYNDKTDILFYFLARAVDISVGYIGFIVSRAFLEAYKADKLRRWLSNHTDIRELIDFRNFYVFEGVGITTAITIYDSRAPNRNAYVYRLKAERPTPKLITDDADSFERFDLPQESFGPQPWTFSRPEDQSLCQKIDTAGIPIGQHLHIGQGMQTGHNEAFGKLSSEKIEAFKLPQTAYYVRARNSDIQRYAIRDSGQYLIYVEDYERFADLPKSVRTYLQYHREKLTARAAYKRGNCDWWRYTWPLHKQYIRKPKIYCPYLARHNRFALDSKNVFLGLTDTTVLYDAGQKEDLRYLLGLLNSRLLTYRFRFIGKLKGGGILEYFWNSISKLPIKTIDFDDNHEVKKHERMTVLVEQLISMNEKIATAKTPQSRKVVERQCGTIDRQIDQLVYDLYGLTEEEIAVVEEAIG